MSSIQKINAIIQQKKSVCNFDLSQGCEESSQISEISITKIPMREKKLCWLVFLTQQFHCILKMYFNMILTILKIFSPSFCEGKQIQCIFSFSFHKLRHPHHGIIFNNIKEWAIDPYSNLGGSHGHCAKQKSHSQKSYIVCVIPLYNILKMSELWSWRS